MARVLRPGSRLGRKPVIDHRGGQGQGALWPNPERYLVPATSVCLWKGSLASNLRSEGQVQSPVPLRESEMTRRTDTLMKSGEARIEGCCPQLWIVGLPSVVHASPQEVIHHTPWTRNEASTCRAAPCPAACVRARRKSLYFHMGNARDRFCFLLPPQAETLEA